MTDRADPGPPPQGEISIDRDGNFRHEGVEITHERTIALFFSGLEPDGAGGFRLRIGPEIAPVRVEDTPLVVRSLDPVDGELLLLLSDGTREPLDAATLRVREDGAFVCAVKGGTFAAKFSRPAHYMLAEHIDQNADGRFVLVLGDARVPIGE